MFNKTLVLAGGMQRINHDVNVTIKRAPTDESVRLLKEFESEARKKILDALAIEGNGFNGVVHFMREPESQKTIYVVIFDLNGKRIETRHIAEWDAEAKTVIPALRDAVAKDIAAHILEAAFKKLPHWPWRGGM